MSTKTIEEFIKETGLKMEYLPAHENHNSDDFKDANHWSCKLTACGKSMVIPYSKGPAHRRYTASKTEAAYPSKPTVDFMDITEPSPPSLAELLECLASDSSVADTSFEDWASDLGYDTDSRNAYKCWTVCQEQTRKLIELIGQEAHAALLLIEF